MRSDKHKNIFRRIAAVALLASLAVLTGCATGPSNAPSRDPFEKFNRGVSQFNEGIDHIALKPAAIAYTKVAPAIVRTGVSNFFGNLGDLWSAVNSALQLKGQNAAENWLRFSFNTVFGFAGVLDIAGEFNIERHKEDFGQTLGRWGVPAGPYLVLPFLGPSTLRDTSALSLDAFGAPLRHVTPVTARNELVVLRAVDARANLLRTSSVLDDAALDKYTFTRDAFLQYRRASITDGKGDNRLDDSPPPEPGPDGKTPAAPGAAGDKDREKEKEKPAEPK